MQAVPAASQVLQNGVIVEHAVQVVPERKNPATQVRQADAEVQVTQGLVQMEALWVLFS